MVERCLEMQKTLYICFIDYTKASDILSKAGVPDKEINIIKNRYLQQKATVRYENETSEEITIKRGVRQGCILSPHGIGQIVFLLIYFIVTFKNN